MLANYINNIEHALLLRGWRYSKMSRRPSSPLELMKCRTHGREKIIMVCEGCNHTFVCLNCLAAEHQGHKCIKLTDYLRLRKISVNELAQDVSDKCMDIKERLKSASECRDENNAKKELIINKIKTKGEEMKQCVDVWINENVDKCEQLYQENENSIDKVTQACRDDINVLKSDMIKCHETLISSTHEEFQSLQKSLKSNTSKSLPKIPELDEVRLLKEDREAYDMQSLLGMLKTLKGYEIKDFQLQQECTRVNDEIIFEEKIAGNTWKGTFGQVPVAIKIYNPNESNTDKENFMEEASILESLTHINVVRLFHGHTSANPVYMVLEYMADGDLQSYLRSTDFHSSSDKLIDFAAQVADGMGFVSSKGIVHRSLMASNILVDSISVKITDFTKAVKLEEGAGICRTCRGDKNNYPIKWTAIESLQKGIFSTKSDVWSFGVLLWEIITGGSLPYSGMENHEVIQHVEDGKTLSIPEFCPRPICDVMLKCWRTAPETRPDFVVLRTLLTTRSQKHSTRQLCNSSPVTYSPRRKGIFNFNFFWN